MPAELDQKLSGKEKAAILLIALGPENSAKIFSNLREEEIETITLEIANISTIMPEVREQVLNEFYQICIAQQYITEGGIGYAKRILQDALGDEKAFNIISKLTASLQVKPFDAIRKTDANQILNFIQGEHPQTIALILSYLRVEQASEIMSQLSPEIQASVTRRIATMGMTSPDVIKEIEKALEKKLSALVTEDYTEVGGVDAVVEILNSVDRTTEKNIMERLEVDYSELSEEIRNKMFIFDDIIALDNRSIQTVLKQEIDNKELAIALKGASEELKNLILANVSTRLSAMIKEEMEFMGPVRRSDVEEAQQKIVNIVRSLQETGEIMVSRGGASGGDDIIA